MGSRAPVYEVDFRSRQFSRNPYPTYEKLRSDFPVCRLPNDTYILSRYDDVRYALKNHNLFGSGWSDAPIIHPGWLSDECKRGFFLPEIDPPLHTTYRNIVKKSFIGSAVEDLIPSIRNKAKELADEIHSQRGEVEFLSSFAYPLASAVVETITGLNVAEDMDRTRTWIELLESFTSESPDPEKKAAVEALILEQNNYYDALIKSRRKFPKNDLATTLANATIDGENLPADQLRSALNLFTLGGFEAPAQLLAKSILVLSRKPELIHLLLAEPEKIPAFTEEVARLSSSAQGAMRMTKEDFHVHGATIPANSSVLALIGSANRDPDQFSDPNTFSISRHNIKSHLGFGYGAHMCIGAAVARIEIGVGLQVLLNAFDGFGCPADSELDWYSTPVGRVLRTFNVNFH